MPPPALFSSNGIPSSFSTVTSFSTVNNATALPPSMTTAPPPSLTIRDVIYPFLPNTSTDSWSYDIYNNHEPTNNPPYGDPEFTSRPLEMGRCWPGEDGGDEYLTRWPPCYIYYWTPHVDVLHPGENVKWLCTCAKEMAPLPTAEPSRIVTRGSYTERSAPQYDQRHDYVVVVGIVAGIFLFCAVVLGIEYSRNKERRKARGIQHC